MDKQTIAALKWALASIDSNVELALKKVNSTQRKIASINSVVYHERAKEQQKVERLAEQQEKLEEAKEHFNTLYEHMQAIARLLGVNE
jgi:hypothetical protein